MLSYNVQVGIGSTRPHHYITQSWKHVLPHARTTKNLNHIAQQISSYDIVALQEVDTGSLRTGFVNLTEYLADKSNFPFWYDQKTRNMGKVAQHSMGLLSKIRPADISEHKLPGLIPGRGAMQVRYGSSEHPLIVVLIHLALGYRARTEQLNYISELVNQFEHVIVMGDLNCNPDSREMQMLFKQTHLREPLDKLDTFPSWRPSRNIDHILVSPSLEIRKIDVINNSMSDHLPVAMEIELPETVHLLA